MRFVVTQIGARRGYAVPEILEKAGTLECFYTDLAGNMGLGKWIVKCGPLLGFKAAAERLAGRKVPHCIQARTITLGTRCLRLPWHKLSQHSPEARFREHLRRVRRFGLAVVRRGFGRATHLYSMLGECAPAIGAAKERGLSVVTEIYILLSAEKIVAEERRKFPQWEPEAPELNYIRNAYPEQKAFLEQTDLFVCPSDAVCSDLREHCRASQGRDTIVPYGIDRRWLSVPAQPIRGRVLFVGTAELRKGIHYLAKASECLRAMGRNYEFRVAGEVTQQLAKQPQCGGLSFIGRIPRHRIEEEYASADVFVLPSLAEGSSESTYEALASGLPVITTAAAGSVTRHGIDGWIVPERDPEALAWRIQQVIEDRQLRGRMSAAARVRAGDYTMERYGARLVAALRESEFTRRRGGAENGEGAADGGQHRARNSSPHSVS